MFFVLMSITSYVTKFVLFRAWRTRASHYGREKCLVGQPEYRSEGYAPSSLSRVYGHPRCDAHGAQAPAIWLSRHTGTDLTVQRPTAPQLLAVQI